MLYHCPLWHKPRRVVVVHQRVMERPKATGKQPRLFEDDPISNQYRYSAYITNLSFSPPDVWRLYSGRADAENRIKELKADFGFDSFNLDNFFGTEAALSIAMLAYNLMALFRQYVLNWKLPKEVIKKTKNLLLTFKKKSRKRIETLFSQLCDQFMLKRNYAKTNMGISVRLLSKITAMTVLQYFNFLNNKPLNRLKYALAA